MVTNELASLCYQLYHHLLKGELKKQTRDDLGISIANILKQGIQFSDSSSHFNNDVDHALVTQLRERGYACLDNLLNDKEIEVLYQYFQDKKLQCVLKDKKIHCHFSKIPSHVDSASYNQTDIQLCPIFYAIAHNLRLLSIAENYLGAPPTIGGIDCRWAFKSDKITRGDQMFHHDRDDFRSLKLFVYLTDTDGNNGAHVYVERSHEYSILKNYVDNEFFDDIELASSFWQWIEKHRKKDIEIERFFDKSMLKTHIGKRGTAFFEDTRGFHKGPPLLKGKRWLFQMLYTLVPVVPFSISQKYEPVKRSDIQGHSNIRLNDKMKFSTRMYYID